MELVIQIVVILLILVNLFLLFMCLRTWKFFHVFVCFLVFGAAIPMLAYTAMVAKARIAWIGLHHQYEELIADQVEQERELLYGDITAVRQEGEEAIPKTIGAVKQELSRWLIGRGRVWRDAQFRGANGENITLSLPAMAAPEPVDPAGGEPVDPDAPAPTVAAPRAALPVDMVVYAFLERPIDTEVSYKVPEEYLGEFKVTASNPGSVTLTATAKLDLRQDFLVKNPGGKTWVLYEMMPVDGSLLFTGHDMEGDRIDDYIPSRDRLKGLLRKSLFPPSFSDEEYEAEIASIHEQLVIDYKYDGKPISEISKLLDREFDPPPEQVWVDVKFLEEHTIQVDAGSGQDNHKDVFDGEGRAVMSGLRQGTETSFKPGDRARLPLVTANALAPKAPVGAPQIVEIGTSYYYRQLNDYGFAFTEIRLQLLQILEESQNLSQEISELQYTLNILQGPTPEVEVAGLIGEARSEIAKLESDKAFLLAERDKVAAYRTALQNRHDQLIGRLRFLFNVTSNLERQLEAYQDEIAAEVRRREAAAVPSSTPVEDEDGI